MARPAPDGARRPERPEPPPGPDASGTGVWKAKTGTDLSAPRIRARPAPHSLRGGGGRAARWGALLAPESCARLCLGTGADGQAGGRRQRVESRGVGARGKSGISRARAVPGGLQARRGLVAKDLASPCPESSGHLSSDRRLDRVQGFLLALGALSGRRRRSVSNLQPWRLPELGAPSRRRLGAKESEQVSGGPSWGPSSLREQPPQLPRGRGVPAPGGPPAEMAATRALRPPSPSPARSGLRQIRAQTRYEFQIPAKCWALRRTVGMQSHLDQEASRSLQMCTGNPLQTSLLFSLISHHFPRTPDKM
ncbi:uncharacterized protein LOC123645701 [Lemur catta]|uniref:uncharacterized protein LOC123645701 n=1 Tax=Lemur catta TaxID=9447 RepID=UPI001E267795|nr:uncharacterized protein LOC123645701 [Lemur catta]